MHPICLVEGPVGAGKSTLAKQLAARRSGVHIALEEWFAQLYSPDRPGCDFVSWYLQRKARLIEALWSHGLALARANVFAVLELGLIQREARYAIYQRARADRVDLKVLVLDAPLELRWQRILRRNEERGATFSMLVPQHVFEMASKLWESPDETEAADQEIEFVSAAQDLRSVHPL
jgi:predicted kinase